jgi:hypothetical protein
MNRTLTSAMFGLSPPVVLVDHQLVSAGAAVRGGHLVRAGAYTVLELLGLVGGGRSDEDVGHQRVEHGQRGLGVQGEGQIILLVHGGPFRELRGQERAVDLAVHLQRLGHVLHGDLAAVRILDVIAELDGPLRGAGQFEAFGQDVARLEVVADLGKGLADGALDGDGGVELVELVVQADQRAVQAKGDGAGAGAACAAA